MRSIDRLAARVVVAALAVCAPTLWAAGSPVQLAYRFRSEGPLTYMLRVEGAGTLTSSSVGSPARFVSPLRCQLDMEFVLVPIEQLPDGANRVRVMVTQFRHQADLPDLGSTIKLFTRDDALVLVHNGRESFIPFPPPAGEPLPLALTDAPADLVRLASLLSQPRVLRVAANGETHAEADSNSGRAALGVVGSAALGAYPRFLSTPVRLKQVWSADIPVEIPGVCASTVTATLMLDSVDMVDNYRWATINVRACRLGLGPVQPTFGCDERFRIEELSQELTGTFVFSVDEGYTVRQDMDMTFGMTVQRMGAGNEALGKIEVDMDVRARLELTGPRGPARPSPPAVEHITP